MLKLANETLDVIKGDCRLQTAMALDEGKWLCHPVQGDHMIMFQYNSGILTISMGESEYELSQGHQIIAFDDELVYAVKKITFKQILDLLNWTCDDYID
jgi:hypothetical protein